MYLVITVILRFYGRFMCSFLDYILVLRFSNDVHLFKLLVHRSISRVSIFVIACVGNIDSVLTRLLHSNTCCLSDITTFFYSFQSLWYSEKCQLCLDFKKNEMKICHL